MHHQNKQEIIKPQRKWQNYTFWIALIFIIGVVAVQLLYPEKRALPFTRLDNEQIGGKTLIEIVDALAKKYTTPVNFKVDNETILIAPFEEVGIITRPQETAERVVDYSLLERFIPFSFFAKPLFTGNYFIQYRLDAAKLRHFVETKLVPACLRQPINATLKTNGDTLNITDGIAGRRCDGEELIRTLQNHRLANVISVAAEKVEPIQNKQTIEPLVLIADQQIKRGVTLKMDDQTVEVDRTTLASWYRLEEDAQTKKVSLRTDIQKITTYIEELNRGFRRESTPTQIILRDGEPEQQVDGYEGRVIDVERTVNELKQLLAADTPKHHIIEVPINRIAAPVEYVRNYGGSALGLSLLLQDLAAEKGDYAITVMELNGKQRQAHVNGDRQYATASTYKMFVAYAVLKEIEAGKITWEQVIKDDLNTIDCFDEMIRYSLNPCSWVFRDMVGGWSQIQGQMQELGLGNTHLIQNNLRSTSNDEALFLRRLEEGTSLQGESRDFLLRLFREQIYRKGIPSAVQWPVANKIGFLEGYLHDVAIVYSPKSTYILAVMTDGGSWWQIADVARRVDAVMQQD